MTSPTPSNTTDSPLGKTASRSGDLPTWLTVIIVTACVAGGGYLGYWYFAAPAKTVTITIDPQRQPDRNRQRPDQRPAVVDWTNDVRPVDRGYEVRADNTRMRVGRAENGAFTVQPGYRSQLLPSDESQFLRLQSRVVLAAQTERLKLSEQQVADIRKFRFNRGMTLLPEDRAALVEAVTAFDKAQGPAKEEAKKALLAKLDEVGKKNIEPTKAELIAYVANVKGVLNEEQRKQGIQ